MTHRRAIPPTVRGRLLALLALGLIVVGCASESSAQPAVIPALTAEEIAALEPGSVDEALTLVDSDGSIVTMSVAEVEALGLVRLTVFEPFVGEEISFEGVLAESVLSAMAARGLSSSTAIEFHALDDYRFDWTVERLLAGQGVIATRSGGVPLALNEGGPFRLVFPIDSPEADEKDGWVWSIDRLGPAD